MIPSGYGTWKETLLNVGSSFNRDIVGHAVAVMGGPGLGDEVIADVHCYKAMYTLIQEHQTDVLVPSQLLKHFGDTTLLSSIVLAYISYSASLYHLNLLYDSIDCGTARSGASPATKPLDFTYLWKLPYLLNHCTQDLHIEVIVMVQLLAFKLILEQNVLIVVDSKVCLHILSLHSLMTSTLLIHLRFRFSDIQILTATWWNSN